MADAKISEIFVSFQGEGPYVGAKQLFVRFYGCSFHCVYCDTKLVSYDMYSVDSLIERIMKYDKPYHAISLTGGEPLEQADYLAEFLPGLKKKTKKRIYLETNGARADDLVKVLEHVDIIAMDMKLPSATKRKACWGEHQRFLKIAKKKDVFVKIVVTKDSDFEDIMKATSIVEGISKEIPIIMQPVTPVHDIAEPDGKRLSDIKIMFNRNAMNVSIIPQCHKILGIK